VPVDFARDDLAQALRAAGHAPDQATFWLWEGVTPYLDADTVARTLAVTAAWAAAAARAGWSTGSDTGIADWTRELLPPGQDLGAGSAGLQWCERIWVGRLRERAECPLSSAGQSNDRNHFVWVPAAKRLEAQRKALSNAEPAERGTGCAASKEAPGFRGCAGRNTPPVCCGPRIPGNVLGIRPGPPPLAGLGLPCGVGSEPAAEAGSGRFPYRIPSADSVLLSLLSASMLLHE
jgi:hypothetical protein